MTNYSMIKKVKDKRERMMAVRNIKIEERMIRRMKLQIKGS